MKMKLRIIAAVVAALATCSAAALAQTPDMHHMMMTHHGMMMHHTMMSHHAMMMHHTMMTHHMMMAHHGMMMHHTMTHAGSTGQ
jgi:hypothetical protein